MQVTAAAFCSVCLTHVSRGVRPALPAKPPEHDLEACLCHGPTLPGGGLLAEERPLLQGLWGEGRRGRPCERRLAASALPCSQPCLCRGCTDALHR